MTPEEELVYINSAIQTLLSGGAVAEWQEGPHKVKHQSLKELWARRDELQNQIYQSNNGITMPVIDANL